MKILNLIEVKKKKIKYYNILFLSKIAGLYIGVIMLKFPIELSLPPLLFSWIYSDFDFKFHVH